jgi:phospholipid/cholesterol/gamma-HCH transport system substrate-binding protein
MREWGRGGRLTAFQAGLLAIVIIVVLAFFSFAKDIPFTQPFQLKATFADAQNIARGSPVRIAGVEVGKVSKIEAAGPDSNATVVTMKLKDGALPIHRDAHVKIRPRIFLEGNFFVDIQPGTPAGGDIKDGDVIPMTQTASSVQIDQVLGTLGSDTRRDLQRLLQGYGEALAGEPQPGEDDDQDPSTRGETAGRSLNDSLRYSGDALRGTAIVNDALLGTELHDLSKLIAGGQKVSAALASRESRLKDLITNLDTTMGAFASEQAGLRETIRLLPRVLEAARPALDNLNRAFPPTRAFAREILSGVRETPATIDASFPWIAQTRRLVSPAELQGLARDLQPATDDLARFVDGTVQFLPQLDLVDRCALGNVLPVGDEVIQDGPFTTGVENYKEFFQSWVGLSGESQNFDGNGQYTRFQPGGGSQTVSTGELPGIGRLFGNATAAPLGTRPAMPSRRPPYRRDVACYRSKRPDLNSAAIGAGP